MASRLRDLVAARDRERAAVAALPVEAGLGLGAYERRVRAECARLGADIEAAAAALAEARRRLAEASWRAALVAGNTKPSSRR